MVGILDPHRHQLPLGAERDLGGPAELAAQFEVIDAGLEGYHREGTLSGVTQHLPAAVGQLAVFGVAAEHAGLEQKRGGPLQAARPGTGGGLQRRGGDGAGGVVAIAGHGQPFGANAEFLHHLAVLGEGAGFVGTDHGDRTQTLHRWQAADQGGAAHHPLGANRQGHGDHGWQTLRHDRHRHRQRDLEQVERVLAHQQTQGHHHRHQRQGTAHQHLGQAIEPLLEGRALAAGGVNQLGDLAQFRGHAGGRNHGHTPAPHHLSSLEQTVLALKHRRGVLEHEIGFLKHGLGLAGEGRLAQP